MVLIPEIEMDRYRSAVQQPYIFCRANVTPCVSLFHDGRGKIARVRPPLSICFSSIVSRGTIDNDHFSMYSDHNEAVSTEKRLRAILDDSHASREGVDHIHLTNFCLSAGKMHVIIAM